MPRRNDVSIGALESWVPLIVGVMTFAVASTLRHPVVFPDESAAISSANFFAGGGARSEWWYLPGYGLFLAPVLLVTKNLSTIYVGVHLVNALLAAATARGLLTIDRSFFPGRLPRHRVMALLVVGAYPAYVYFAALAISDNVLVAGAVWSVVALDRATTSGRTSDLVGRMLAVTSLLAVHVRALPIVVAWLVVAVSMVATSRRDRQMVATVGVIGALGFSMLGRALVDYERTTGLADLTRQSPSDLVSDLLGVRSLLVLPFTALGQLMYLLLASLGLVALGVAVLARMGSSSVRRETVVGRFVLLGLALSWVLSATFTNQGQGDLAMYGRYMEAVLAVPLYLGVVSMLDADLPRWFRRVVPTGTILLSCLVVGIRGYDAFDGRDQLLNIAGVAMSQRITGSLDPVIFGLLAAAAMLVLITARRMGSGVATVFVLTVFSLSTFAVLDRAVEFAGTYDEGLDLLRAIERVDTDVCVGLDQASLVDFSTQELYRLNDLSREYTFVDTAELEEGGEPLACSELLITERSDLGDVLPGWRPVGVETARPQWLWVGPGLVDLFEAEVLNGEVGAELDDQQAVVEMRIISSRTIEEGEGISFLLELTNTTDSVFVPVANLPDGVRGMGLGLEWRDPERPDVRLHEPWRVSLPTILRPGDSIVLEGELMTSVPEFDAKPGEWIVRAEVVQELVRWFGDDGFAEQRVVIERPS